jgi:hypothetical protein
MSGKKVALMILTMLGTLTASNAGGSSTLTKNVNASLGGTAFTAAFTMAQTLSDEAQRTTLAFSGLAMMTGNLDAQSFFPPGKVADYTGFQYLRDNDPDSMGHNTSFLTRVANNVIYILNDSQFAQLKTLAVSQQDQINLYGYKRFPLMKAFRRLLDGDIPSGSAGLNLNAVKKASRELYLLDGQISFDRAMLYANILSSMDSSQKAYLGAMKGKGWSSWPDITNDQIRIKMQGLPQGTAVAVMTYASDLFSWYAGSVEADVYFCPERQGTYYGSFYIKDAPAIGHEGYSINEQLTATAGAALSDSSKGYVTQEQASLISSLVDTQRNNLYAGSSNIVQVRTQIATLLRSLLISTASSTAVNAQVLTLSGTYGDLDGENNWNYAKIFTQVYNTLSSSQKTALTALRKSIMSGTYADGTPFDYSLCTTPFLYSSVISDLTVLDPYISDTDYLFFEPPDGDTNTHLYFPHVDTNLPWQTEIAIINTSNQTVTGTLRGLSNDGQIIETKAVTLSARSRRQIIVADEFTNHTNIGYIIFDTDSASVQGYTKLYQAGIYRAAIPAVKEVNTSDIHISHIESSAQWWTGMSLVNTTSAIKNLTITFNNGVSVPFTLNANQHRVFTIGSLLNEPLQPDIHSAVITNANGVIGLELFGSTGSANQMDGILLTDKTASNIYYPHMAGGDWWTGIVAYNPSVSACTITITPYSAQGTALATSTLSIAGKGKYVGTVAQLGLPAQTAWFRIDSTSPITGFELFGTASGNQLAAYAESGGTGGKAGVFAKIEKSGGWTGIAFVNTENSKASVTLTAYNDNGNAVATQVLPVGGHAKVDNVPEQIFTQDISSATYIAFSSNRNIVCFQLNGSSDGTMLDGLPGLAGTN